MKIACTADWHIHAFSDFSRQVQVIWDEGIGRFVESDSESAKELNSRLLNILDGICDLRDYCVENDISVVLNAGDVFHKRGSINVDTFNAAHKVIKSFADRNIELIILSGNHDQTDASDLPTSSIHTLYNVATIIEKPCKIDLKGTSVVAIPYSRNKKFVLKSINKYFDSNSKNNILMAHLGVTGGAVGSGMYLMNDEYSMKDLKWDKWKYVVLGHYHRPQLLSHNSFYCGTPVQNTFNDEIKSDEDGGFNGFFVVDTSKRYDVQFVPIKRPRFITINSPEDVPDNMSTDFYRIKTPAEAVEAIKSVIDEENANVRLDIERNYAELDRSDIGISDSFEEAVKKYAKENYEGELGAVVDVGLEILAEAISGGK